MKLVKIMGVALCITHLLTALSHGQAGIYSVRSAGLGGVGSTFENIHAVPSNPGGLAGIEALAFSSGFQNHYGVHNLNTATVCMGFPVNKHGSAGMMISSFGTGEYRHSALKMLYARKITGQVNAGLQTGVSQIAIEGYGRTFGYSIAGGIHIAVTPAVTLATVSGAELWPLKQSDNYMEFWLVLGLTYRPGQKTSLYAEVSKDARNPVIIRTGIEYSLLEKCALRLGFQVQPALFTIGMGYLIQRCISLDISMKYNAVLGISTGLGLTYTCL